METYGPRAPRRVRVSAIHTARWLCGDPAICASLMWQAHRYARGFRVRVILVAEATGRTLLVAEPE